MLRPGSLVLFALCVLAPRLAAQGRTVSETEPNNSAATATMAALGDTLVGFVNPAGDVDWFAFEVPAGTWLTIPRGNPRYTISIVLVNADGGGMGGMDADDTGNRDTISTPIGIAGRHYIAIEAKQGGGSPDHNYSIVIKHAPFTPGPGDHIRQFARGLFVSKLMGAAAAPSGDIFFVSGFGVGRIASDGSVSRFAEYPYHYGGLAIDASGRVLVASVDNVDGVARPVVWRHSPTGERTVFVRLPSTHEYARGVVVDPSGDVWIGPAKEYAQSRWRIWRTDPLGVFRDSLDVSVEIRAMAFSPSGELYFTAAQGIYKLVNDVPHLVAPVASDTELGNLAFDRDGYLYVAAGSGVDLAFGPERARGRVILYDPQLRVVQDPVAHVPHIFGGLLFARDTDGSTTARLLAAQTQPGRLVELNPSGIRAPGWPVGAQQLQIDRTALRSGTVGSAYADTLRVTGASGPVTWAVTTGALPAGISLTPATGVVGGTPTDTGSFSFDVRATNGTRTASAIFSISVTHQAVTVTAAEIAEALDGGPALSAETVQALDAGGNRNGILDVGDLRAFLRTQGHLVGGRQP